MKRHPRVISIVLTFTYTICGSVAVERDIWAQQASRAEAMVRQGEMNDALTALGRLIESLRRSDPKSVLLPRALDRRGSLEQHLGRLGEAEHDYSEAIDCWRASGTPQTASLATEFNNLASIYSSSGRLKQAEAMRRESLELRLELLGSDNSEVALSYSNLAVDLFREASYTESSDLCKRALTIWLALGPENNRSDLAFDTLALIELHTGHPAEALAFALAALDTYRAYAGTDTSESASYEHTVALALQANGQLEEANQEFKKALEDLDELKHGAVSSVRIGLLMDYAHLLNRLKRAREAKRLEREAALAKETLVKENHWQQTVDLNSLLQKR